MDQKIELLTLLEYCETQKKLIDIFLFNCIDSKDKKWLLDFPKKGTLLVDSKYWIFQRHGIGVRFKQRESGLVVDVTHKVFETDFFDAWRFKEYLISKHGECVNDLVVSRTINDAIELGLLKRLSDGFELLPRK